MPSDTTSTTNRFDFTKSTINRLPTPSTGVAYYYDTKAKGLALSVGTTGRKSFLLYRKIKGRPERIKIGPYPDLSIEQARKSTAVLNAQIAQDANPADTGRAKRNEMTLAELFEKYYEQHSSLRKVTHLEDIEHFRRHVNTSVHGPNLAKLPLSEVTRAKLTAHHARMRAIPTTANRVLALVSSMFSKAIQWSYFEGVNPCRGIEKFPERARERFVQPDEMPRLLYALENEENETVRDFLLTALFTGARRSNVLTMQWADVHMERKEWRIARTKNGTAQTIPLPQAAIEVLQRRQQAVQGLDTPYVFPGPGANGHIVDPQRAWDRVLARGTALGLVDAIAARAKAIEFDYLTAVEEATNFPHQTIERFSALARSHGLFVEHYEMRDLHMHDLRRTLGSWLASGGTSLPIIGKALNHKSPQATQIYARLMLGPVRDAMEEATNAMRNAKGV
ncbi:tyrosine-type recombinase/integrase [Acidovorax sp. HDW3]|uniref:tyrosine-type recombinase/integrase n=1 Tax=Acidovorax sp. HDW3 TaxID=2714923 RepID=UPI001407702A|nr:site-specific integrase [Acidovorax sp. HDW3]QIL43175.1 tyrosine-type recombinase/integrase [Acidovorax sp. HDW3]